VEDKLTKLDLRTWVVAAVILLAALLNGQVAAQAASTRVRPLASANIPAARMQEYSDMAVDWMQQYLRIDTTNPPGNEMLAAQFFKKILDQEGI
jgi:hypothetical protein